MQRKNINRGYMTLHVWQNSVLLYKEICRVFRPFSYELKKAEQINKESFELLDKLSYQIENQLINLIKSIELKKEKGNWNDCLLLMEKEGYYSSETIH